MIYLFWRSKHYLATHRLVLVIFGKKKKTGKHNGDHHLWTTCGQGARCSCRKSLPELLGTSLAPPRPATIRIYFKLERNKFQNFGHPQTMLMGLTTKWLRRRISDIELLRSVVPSWFICAWVIWLNFNLIQFQLFAAHHGSCAGVSLIELEF